MPMSKSLSPKRIGSIFADHALILSLRQKSEKIKPIQEFIDSFLDSDIAEQFIVANSGNDHIVLMMNSPAWATKIRYLVPVMLDNFARHEQLQWIKKIDVTLSKQNFRDDSRPLPKSTPPGQRARQHIQEFAQSLDDEELAGALKRLASAKADRDKNR